MLNYDLGVWSKNPYNCRQGKRNPAEVGASSPICVIWDTPDTSCEAGKRSISDAKAQRLKYVPHPSFVESNWFEATQHPIISHPCVTSTHSQRANRLTLSALGVVGTLSWSAWTSLSQALGLMFPSCNHRLMWSIQKPCGYDGRSSSTRKHTLLPDVLLTWFR